MSLYLTRMLLLLYVSRIPNVISTYVKSEDPDEHLKNQQILKTIMPDWEKAWDRNGLLVRHLECRLQGARQCCQDIWKEYNLYEARRLFRRHMRKLRAKYERWNRTKPVQLELPTATLDEVAAVQTIEADDAHIGPSQGWVKRYFTFVCYDTRSDRVLSRQRESRKSRRYKIACAEDEYAEYRFEESLRKAEGVVFKDHSTFDILSAICVKRTDFEPDSKRVRTTNLDEFGLHVVENTTPIVLQEEVYLQGDDPGRRCIDIPPHSLHLGDAILTQVLEPSTYLQGPLRFGSAKFDDDLGIGDFASTDDPSEQVAEADVLDFTDLWDSVTQEDLNESLTNTNEPLHIHSLDLMVERHDRFGHHYVQHQRSENQGLPSQMNLVLSGPVWQQSLSQEESHLRVQACIAPAAGSNRSIDNLSMRTTIVRREDM